MKTAHEYIPQYIIILFPTILWTQIFVPDLGFKAPLEGLKTPLETQSINQAMYMY